MGSDSGTPRQKELFPICWVCRRLMVVPGFSSVDATGDSGDEMDELCIVHRARATEGYCVRCARRTPWLPLDDAQEIGLCRTCAVGVLSEERTRSLEHEGRVLEED
jgi:hypothetical protein